MRDRRQVGFDRDSSIIQAMDVLSLSITRNDFAIRTENLTAQFEAIRCGLGIGITLTGLTATWESVVQVLADLPMPHLDLWIVGHRDVRYNRRVRLAMDFLGERSSNPYDAQA